MIRKYFGTDGVRGVYGGPLVNDEMAACLGVAVMRWLQTRERSAGKDAKTPSGRSGEPCAAPVVLLGRDTRASGVSLEAAVARGLRAAGAEPVSLGVLPMPALALALQEGGELLGVMITASHNPAPENGIKLLGAGGLRLTDEDESAIEEHWETVAAAPERPLPVRAGAAGAYIARCLSLLPRGSLADWRVVLDTAHGATCTTSPEVLRRLGAEVVAIGGAPDGGNINDGVGSEHPEHLAARVRAEGARLGIAHDGDGDRCVLCDEKGGIVDGDEILTVLGTQGLARGRLARGTLVVTEQSNLGVDVAIAAAGGRVVRTPVGERYVVQRMRAEGATLGGETSGHIVCAEVTPTGDGLVAALKMIEVMRETGQPLSVLRQRLNRSPQRSVAVPVVAKPPLEAIPELQRTMRELEAELGASGRLFVRYSGTESKLRLHVEGPNDVVVAGVIDRLRDAVARAGLAV